jgi:hypothetical protein
VLTDVGKGSVKHPIGDSTKRRSQTHTINLAYIQIAGRSNPRLRSVNCTSNRTTALGVNAVQCVVGLERQMSPSTTSTAFSDYTQTSVNCVLKCSDNSYSIRAVGALSAFSSAENGSRCINRSSYGVMLKRGRIFPTI